MVLLRVGLWAESINDVIQVHACMHVSFIINRGFFLKDGYMVSVWILFLIGLRRAGDYTDVYMMAICNYCMASNIMSCCILTGLLYIEMQMTPGN